MTSAAFQTGILFKIVEEKLAESSYMLDYVVLVGIDIEEVQPWSAFFLLHYFDISSFKVSSIPAIT